jgi:dTDP-glucose 4,6-dehydratase
MKIAIIGAGGCFALNFARKCNDRGIDHFGIGRSHVKPAAFWQIDHRLRYWPLHLVHGLKSIMAVLDTERPDVVVNFAAQGEGAASFGDFAPDFFRTNTVALAQFVCELRKRDYLRRFVNIGTSELYGSTEHPAKESECLKPSSPYAISKAAFDQYLISMHKTHGFPMNIIRPSNCYTPGQQLYRVIPKAIVSALSGRKLPLHGGGMAQKSYLHATDLSRAILDVIDKAQSGGVYNVAPASPISIRALITHVAEACGVSFEELVEEVPDRVGQDAKYALDATAIARECGWVQTIGLQRGLDEMVRWVKRHPELLTMDTGYNHRP